MNQFIDGKSIGIFYKKQPSEIIDLYILSANSIIPDPLIFQQIAVKLGIPFTPAKVPSCGGVVEDRGGQTAVPTHPPLPTPHPQNTTPIPRNTRNYMQLPYNPALKERARALRKAGNLPEVLFWNQVKKKQFKGLDFDRQKIIGNYIADFYCSQCQVVVEIDGSSHNGREDYDATRDAYLTSLGLTVIRIPVISVFQNLAGVMDMLHEHSAFGVGRESAALDGIGEMQDHPALAGTPPGEGTFGAVDVMDYVYAILHSPGYREKYKEFLKIDFPRVPYPKDAATFWQLVNLGSQIRQIHLLESPTVEQFITQYPIVGDNEVVKPRFDSAQRDDNKGKVFINDTQYFDNVPQIAWEFYIGGYQPAQKWLKDRKDRKLEFEDILHYQKIIVALTETDRLMKEIDKINIE